MKKHTLTLLGTIALAALAIAPLNAQTSGGHRGTGGPRTQVNSAGSAGHWRNRSGSDGWRYRRHRGYSNFYFGSGFGFGYPFGYGGYPYGYGYGSPYGYGYSPFGYGGYSRFGYGGYGQQVVRGEALGSNGSIGAQVQQRLAREGYYRGPIDGVVGSGTRRAIRSYERAHGLPVDGLIDRQFLATLGLA